MTLGYDQLEAAVRATGLSPRGGFLCRPEDGVPALADGRPAGSLVMLGNVGSDIWPAFQAAPEASDGGPEPMNRWSARVIDGLASELGARALYPFGGPPYHPFQRWAQRAEPLWPSPLGMLIHPVYGLWHAYRGALAFAETLALPPRPNLASPCESCADKPCLSTCPVAAFGPAGYDVPACALHIAAPQGRDCLDAGCRARRACPVGREHLYDAAQAGFHMRAFLAARARESGTKKEA